MSTVYLLCGVPASGKSTYCKNNVPKDAVYVSRDVIRFSMVKPNEPYFSKEELVKAIESYGSRKRRFGKTDEQL